MRQGPLNIQVIGTELAILWTDKGESYINLEKLRRACPCAGCGGEPDVMGHVIRPKVTYSGSSFQIQSYEIVGGYAIQPVWKDGHATGLYSFDSLRSLAEHTP